MLFAEPCRRGGVNGLGFQRSLFSLTGPRMTVKVLRHRLTCLGWKTLDSGRLPDGRWWLLATSCGHAIVARGDSREEVWSAACAMALKLTREGLARAHDDT